MKKKYAKPALITSPLALQSTVIRTCTDAEEYWWATDMFDGNVIFVPNDMPDCTITEWDYMDINGDDDKNCLYSPTDSAVTFNS